MISLLVAESGLAGLVCETPNCLSYIMVMLDIFTVLYLAFCASFRMNKGVRIFGWVWTAAIVTATVVIVAIHTCIFTLLCALFTAICLMAVIGVTLDGLSGKNDKGKDEKTSMPVAPVSMICPMVHWQCAMAEQPKAAVQPEEPVVKEEKKPVVVQEKTKEAEPEVKVVAEVKPEPVVEPEEIVLPETIEEPVSLDKTEVSAVSNFEDDEDEEGSIFVDESGVTYRTFRDKSFVAKICQMDEAGKNYYNALKNEALSYSKTRSRISWQNDSINSGRNQVIKFAVKGKTLCVYFALNPDDYVDSKYKVEKADSARYDNVPCLYRIKNDRRAKYAAELLEIVCHNFKLAKGPVLAKDYSLPYEPTTVLMEKGQIKLVTRVVSKPKKK